MVCTSRKRVLTFSWLLSLFVLAALFACFPNLALAQRDRQVNVQPQISGQVFTDNLTVRAGEVYENDVTVLSGNVIVEQGGRIEGSLNVLAGNIEIHEGGEVEQDVSALSGNIWIAGEVGGDVAAMSGNIELTDTARVDGDISIVSGNLQRAEGARVDGDVVRGRGFPVPFSGWPGAPEEPTPPRIVENRQSFWGWLGWMILRLVLAVIFTVVVVGLVALLYNLRPDILRPVHATMMERTAYSFIIGVIVNLVLVVITTILFAMVVLCLGGIVTGAILVAINLVGWAVVSYEFGQRLTRYIHTPIQPLAATVLGALLLTGVVALLWALGGCFWPAAFLIWLLASSLGVGAAVMRWLKLDSSPRQPAPPSGQGPSAPPTPPPAPSAPDTGRGPGDVAVYDRPDIVATESPVAEAPSSVVTASEPSTDQPDNPPVTPVEAAASGEPATDESDFTVIKGIGTTLDRRLKEAGIRTFAQLAALSNEEIAAILGWTPQRVSNADLAGQARHFQSK
jgi:predicted flap endonuclease-1-like 5' DNA nuclease/cytoskeletal protein CcmA (bactofilin family)